jgi:hypothetical protein
MWIDWYVLNLIEIDIDFYIHKIDFKDLDIINHFKFIALLIKHILIKLIEIKINSRIIFYSRDIW